jgi:hypothetical protein
MNRGRRGTVYIFSCALCGVIIFSCFSFEIPTDILLLREHFPWLDHFFFTKYVWHGTGVSVAFFYKVVRCLIYYTIPLPS